MTAPFVLLGLWREHQILKVPLFNRYADQPDKPLIEFRAILKVRPFTLCAAKPSSVGRHPQIWNRGQHVAIMRVGAD